MLRFLFTILLAVSAQMTVQLPAQATTRSGSDYNLSENFYGFVDIGDKEIYVDYLAPQKGKPTIVLLNGLTYSTQQWARMEFYFKKMGVGVLMYDMAGQGRTLLNYGVKPEPYNYMDQVEDLDALLTTLKIKRPYNIAGLSYGGGILTAYAAKYPRKIGNAILMAPYTEPLDQQDQWIRSQIWATRQIFPYNKYSDEQLYDYFLKQIVYSTYPVVEPIVLENPLKLEAVFRMTQGIRKFKAVDVANQLPANTIHLLIAENDQYIPRQVLEQFWEAVPNKSRASLTIAPRSEHKIPESVPGFAAEYIYNIIK